MIANRYTPGQGIVDHVDLVARFEDGVAVASFGSCVVMEFRPRTRTSEDAAAAAGSSSSSSSHPRDVVVPVLLRPGDVICLTGDARYRWMHGIPARTEDWWEGAAIARRERVSITLRKLTLNGSLLTY
ncbi:hypothetical protein DFJ73DRAFT_664497 [Zopfochytrium polystomum]|nr:hypothetical protein DFJ73DRAFT_664497 [Zopfochytrium polystomum]